MAIWHQVKNHSAREETNCCHFMDPFYSYNGRYRDPDQVTCYGRKEGNVLFNDAHNTPVMEGRKEMFYLMMHTTHLLWKEGRKCFI